MRRSHAAALTLLLVCLGADDARAHARSTSTSSWDLEAGARPAGRVVVRVRLDDLQRVLVELSGMTAEMIRLRPQLGQLLDRYLLDRVALFAGEERCPATGPPQDVPSADPSHIGRRWQIRCPAAGPPSLRIELFTEAIPGHVHLARARLGDGKLLERVFVLDQPSFAWSAEGDDQPARGSGLLDYVRLGVEHIATGLDHLVFLLALLLLGVSLLEVATIVTGFTFAHSVTLALGVLGVVEPLSAAVESLIGLSIVVVALENFHLTTGRATGRWIVLGLVALLGLSALGAAAGIVAVPPEALIGVGLFALCYLRLLQHSRAPARMRWFVAFVFGLVHGFGFAGLLTEVGLPPDRIAAALLGFNLGVELGQLAVVAVAWPLLGLALRGDAVHRVRAIQLGSTPVLVAGLFWFVSRAFGAG